MSERDPIDPTDIFEIYKLLPHRYPFLMVDRVTAYEAGKWLTAYKNVTANEPCFAGHFPEHPVFPGVLMLEALAQAAGILTFKTNEALENNKGDYLYLFAGVNKARFKRMVIPGDVLKLEVEVLRHRKDFGIFKATATVDGFVACEAELLSARKEVHVDKE